MENTNFDVVVALGQNWERSFFYRLRSNRSQPPELSAASKLDAVAAAELYAAGQAKEILFSSGHTAGVHFPSEAQAMKSYVLKLFPDIPESALLTEDISIDTAQNAQEVRRILDLKEGEKKVGLLTIGRHMRRSERLFTLAGVEVAETFAADKLPIDDPLYKAHVRAYRRSSQYTTRAVTEPIARLTVAAEMVLQLKPGSILGAITRYTRR